MAVDNITPLHGRDEVRRMHYLAAAELIDDAIDLLALLELLGHLEDREAGKHFTVDATTIATAARTIVATLRKAQSHHREVLL